MDDYDDKDMLPVHIILGANDYAKICTDENLRVGKTGEQVAEHTRFGWSLMSPGEDGKEMLGCLAVNSTSDYDNLCALDVLGLADNAGADNNVFDKFKEQLTRSEDGWYETTLPWTPGHQPLLSNHDGSVHRLNSLLRKLKQTNMLPEYDAVIREQINQGIVEKLPTVVTGEDAVVREKFIVQ